MRLCYVYEHLTNLLSPSLSRLFHVDADVAVHQIQVRKTSTSQSRRSLLFPPLYSTSSAYFSFDHLAFSFVFAQEVQFVHNKYDVWKLKLRDVIEKHFTVAMERRAQPTFFVPSLSLFSSLYFPLPCAFLSGPGLIWFIFNTSLMFVGLT